jgi:hypothetical protein
MIKCLLFLAFMAHCSVSLAQDILPPVQPWNGRSTALIAANENTWITPAEASGFSKTPSYQETNDWLRRLSSRSPLLNIITIGTSGQGRAITMVIASSEKAFTKETLTKSVKPLLLIQAGIHSGEIDGKDAGMMLLRDIAFGGKNDLLKGVNVLFIPVLNVDGHERTSPYNRVNQRGPDNMGWRTNSRNLNLNRDYAKADTEEIQAVIRVINDFKPDLYLDVHVTDGADYQYDITYGFSEAYSKASGQWLRATLSPFVDAQLRDYGHIPGPLVFSANNMDFTEGMVDYAYSPRFSNGYGDARHLPTILIENHSLKPFRQRVLGTYVFLEAVIRVLSAEGLGLKKAVAIDEALRSSDAVVSWKTNETPDSIRFLGIEAQRKRSEITGAEYVVWTAKPVTETIPLIRYNQPDKIAIWPRAFWIPGVHKDVINRLRIHGIQMEEIKAPREVTANFFKVDQYKLGSSPTEGRVMVNGTFSTLRQKAVFYPGSVRVKTDQPLGNLAIQLLHPGAPDSFFQWGFFLEMFSRTEYIEQYVIEPLAAKMLAENDKLREEFDQKKKDDAAFASSPHRIAEWFYVRTPYFDQNWLIYPVGWEE